MPRTVLYLHSSAGRYGADLQLVALAGGLDRSRWRPLAVLPERGTLAPLLEEAGVEVVVRPLAVVRRTLATPRGIALTAARAVRGGGLVRLARQRDAAIVHSNTSVVLGGGRARAAHVIHVREIYAGGRAVRALWPAQRARILRADAVLCVSEAVAAQFGDAPNVQVVRDCLARTPAPVERAEARAVLGLDERSFVVALIGRVSDWKGQDVLARALAEQPLAEFGAVGLVAGSAYPGHEAVEHRLRRLRDELGLGERLRLLGHRDDVGTVLGAADAVAIPSTRPEPLGQVALEAAAVGVPVVASDSGGLPEAVGDHGTLVPPGDHVALALALRALAENPGDPPALDARFERARMVEAVQEVYERISR